MTLPTIVLPGHLVHALEGHEMESILVHELLHIRRGDTVVHWLATLTRIVYFFHPICHLTFRRLVVERELAVDEMAVQEGERKPMEYGKTLLKVASSVPRLAHTVVPSLALSEAAQDLGPKSWFLIATEGRGEPVCAEFSLSHSSEGRYGDPHESLEEPESYGPEKLESFSAARGTMLLNGRLALASPARSAVSPS